MEVTFTIPESILTQLQQRSVQLNMSLNELLLKLLRDGIARQALEIPASSRSAITRGGKVGNMVYIQELIDNPPTDTLTVDDWKEHLKL